VTTSKVSLLCGHKTSVPDVKENMTDENEVQEQVVPEQSGQIQSENSQPEPVVEKKATDVNWEKANEVLKMQRMQIEELKAQMAQMAKKPEVVEKDEFDELDQDDALTVGQARKLAEKLAEKKAKSAAKEMVDEYIKQQSVVNDEAQARAKYEDYDYVVENRQSQGGDSPIGLVGEATIVDGTDTKRQSGPQTNIYSRAVLRLEFAGNVCQGIE